MKSLLLALAIAALISGCDSASRHSDAEGAAKTQRAGYGGKSPDSSIMTIEQRIIPETKP